MEETAKADRNLGRHLIAARARARWVTFSCFSPKIPAELYQTGREYFARSPGSDIWVWFGDLPNATRDTLWEKHKAKLAFPAGLPVYINGKWYLRKDANGEELEEFIIDYSDKSPF